MPQDAAPPGRRFPWPGDGGPLLAAFWAVLTAPALASPALDSPARHGPALDSPALDGPALASTGPPRADLAAAPSSATAIVELAGLSAADLHDHATPPPPAAWPDGIVPPSGFLPSPPPTQDGPGFGFGQGDPLDLAAPGPGLAVLADDAQAVLAGIDDDCLIGVIRGWRRLTSWATGRELAAVAELARRYPPDGLPGTGREYVADELSAALTLTGHAAHDERDLAWQLANVLPATLTTLTAGLIDLPRARVIVTGTAELTPGHAAAAEAAVLPNAPGMTTGQLRAAVAKAVLAADPTAATRQREAAQTRAHVSCWTGQSGTAHLEGHDLPPAQTLAADTRLGQIATAWKAHGAHGGIDLLRAHAYLALLLGHDVTTPPASLLTPGHLPAHPTASTTGSDSSSRGGTPATRNGSGAADTSTGDTGDTGGHPAGTPATSNGGGASPHAGHAGGASSGARSPHAGHPGHTSSNAASTSTSGAPPTPPTGHPDTTTTSSSSGGGPGTNRDPGPDPGAGRADRPGSGPQAPPGLRPPTPAPEPGYPLPPVAAMINLTIPLDTLQQLSGNPGEAAGYGPIAPATAQALASAAAGHPATRWQLTVTSPDGRAVATGAPRGRAVPAEGWTVTVTPITTGDCDHRNQEPGYRPSPALARLIRTRNATCCFPGCRRPARRCDLDHTVPYEDGGRTCECGLAPSCQ